MMGSREGGGPGDQRGDICCLSREERAWELVGGKRGEEMRERSE